MSSTFPKQRQTNIELLRIVAMFMVVFLHCNTFGGNLKGTIPLTPNWFGVWFIEALAICAVNCYVLVSGYFLVTSKFKWDKLISIWIKILFYSILFYSIFGVAYGWGSVPLISSMLPVLTRSYWFATTYIALYAISPFLNILIKAMTKIQHQCCMMVLIMIFCIWPSLLPFAVTLDTTNGYGIIWFVVLYIIAAYVRLYIPIREDHKKYYLLVYIGVVVLSLVSRIIEQNMWFPWIQAFQRYNGIGVLISSMAVFMYFLTIKIKNCSINKFIVTISGLTFGVYLIHENAIVRDWLYDDLLNLPARLNTSTQIVYIIICAIGIYVVASFIEYLRQRLFAMIKVDNIANKIGNVISVSIEKIQQRLNP